MPIKKSRLKKTKVPGILKVGPDKFLVRARWIDPKTGQRRKKEKVASNFGDAILLQAKLKGKNSTEKLSRLKFRDYAKQWLKIHGPNLEDSTMVRYKTAIAHSLVEFGDYYVDAFEPSDIRDWLSSMNDYGAITRNGWLRVLRVVLDDAVTDKFLPGNPARAVKALPEGRTKGKRGTALSLEQFRRTLNAIKQLKQTKEISEDVARMLLTSAWTGMRRGELLAIKWTDTMDGELLVQRSVYRRNEKATKTDDPRRITIVQPLADVLAEQRQWLLKMQHPGLKSGLIFPASPQHAKIGAKRRGTDEVSWYRSPSIFDEPLVKVVEKAAIPAISPQSFRRTWEDLLREAGVDQLVRRALSGWRTEKAQGIYATVDKKERDLAADSMMKMVLGNK